MKNTIWTDILEMEDVLLKQGSATHRLGLLLNNSYTNSTKSKKLCSNSVGMTTPFCSSIFLKALKCIM